MKTSKQQAAVIWLQGFLTNSPATETDIMQSCPYKDHLPNAMEALAYLDDDGLYHLQTFNITANLSR